MHALELTRSYETLTVSVRLYFRNYGNVLCICTPRTYWANTNGCPGISLDLDNTNGGLSGAETMTLTDSTENQVSCDWSRAVVLTSDWSSTGSTASP